MKFSINSQIITKLFPTIRLFIGGLGLLKLDLCLFEIGNGTSQGGLVSSSREVKKGLKQIECNGMLAVNKAKVKKEVGNDRKSKNAFCSYFD